MTDQVNTEQTPEQKNDKEYNFSQLRKQAEASERGKQEAIQKAAALERELQDLRKGKDVDLDDDDPEEPYVDHRKLNKKLKAFEQSFDKRVDDKAEAKARSLIEQERNQNFLKQNPDFHEILQPSTLQKFAEKHPEIAEPMLEMPDTFARQKLLYQNIKALNVHKPQQQETVKDKIEANKRSPYYQQSGPGAPPYAGGQGDFSDSGQKQAYEKIQALKKSLRI